MTDESHHLDLNRLALDFHCDLDGYPAVLAAVGLRLRLNTGGRDPCWIHGS